MLHRIFFLLVSLSLIACGTDTGNPGLNSSTDNFGNKSAFASQLAVSVCIRIVGCHPEVIKENCENQLFRQNQWILKLGLDPTEYSTLREVEEGELSGDLDYRRDVAKICLDQISARTCQEATVVDAYDPSLDDPFEKAFQMTSASCDGVYEI